jgi:hypothetical protein
MEKFFLCKDFFLDWLLEQILPNVFPFFAIKLGRFMANACLHMLKILKLNSENWKTKKSKIW